MEKISGLGTNDVSESLPLQFESFYSAKSEPEMICFQDPKHLVVKVARRTLKCLKIGFYTISMTTIKTLIQSTDKAKHGLVISDIVSKDKMSYDNAKKLSRKRVTECLAVIPGSEGMVEYLYFQEQIKIAYIYNDSTPAQRIYAAFYAVFFARYWREWLIHIQKMDILMGRSVNEVRSLDNFISSNSYAGIELNAHSIVTLLRKCRNLNAPHLFLPTLMSSQPCEEYFRRTRSMTSTFHTATEFDILDILNRAKRSQALLDLSNDNSLYNTNLKKERCFFVPQLLPTDEEIYEIVQDAQSKARNVMLSMGK